ncbi:MAG: AraC family ligand binding domain-containing protein, partial [Anderseniella sp.]|nr:AraC family ligand binding domain-containing protein [Anderseniella sp.]
MAVPRPPAFISRQVVDGRYYFGELTPPPDTPVAVACAGCEDCAADYRMVRRYFRYHALEFIDNGQWRLRMAERTVVLGPGSVFAYGPAGGYRLEALGGSPLRKYFVDFSGRQAGQLMRRHGIPGDRPVSLHQPARMREV